MTHVVQIEEKAIGAIGPVAAFVIYRPVCSCGQWVGIWSKTRGAAVAIGNVHRMANAPA